MEWETEYNKLLEIYNDKVKENALLQTKRENLQNLCNNLRTELADSYAVIEEIEDNGDTINELEKSYSDLEEELNEAYMIIDDLEMQIEMLGEK